MKFIKNENVIRIMQKNLDYVDPRLMDHGKRVAYLVFKTLEKKSNYSAKEMRDICLLAMLHDIGAYKTEEIDRLVQFETVNIWGHSIYGYLFLKYFSPLKDLAPVVLFHHADCSEINALHPSYRELAQLFSLCDRADLYSNTSKDIDAFPKYLEAQRDKKFCSDIVDMFLEAGIDLHRIYEGMCSDEKFSRILYDTPMSEKEADDYIKMTIFSIDFRSPQTVVHTIPTAYISGMLVKLSGFGEEEADIIRTGAMLHDIGKTGVPVDILENSGRLDESEMAVMKNHVKITEKIIAESVRDEIKRIAVRHHEKLNGTGYPRGLSGDDLNFNERILAVADIFSALCGARSYKDAYPKERIKSILYGMSEQGLIDSGLVSLAIDNYDKIIEGLDEVSLPIIGLYHRIGDEYKRLYCIHEQ